MAYPDDLASRMASDYLVWNDVETITYLAKTSEAPPTSGISVTNTLWLAIRKDRLTGESLLAEMDLTVNLPKAKMGTTVPKIDDIMVRSDGTRWVIKLVEIVATGQEYRVHVKRSQKGT